MRGRRTSIPGHPQSTLEPVSYHHNRVAAFLLRAGVMLLNHRLHLEQVAIEFGVVSRTTSAFEFPAGEGGEK